MQGRSVTRWLNTNQSKTLREMLNIDGDPVTFGVSWQRDEPKQRATARLRSNLARLRLGATQKTYGLGNGFRLLAWRWLRIASAE
jgi:hypothetical protein